MLLADMLGLENLMFNNWVIRVEFILPNGLVLDLTSYVLVC